MNGTGGTGVLCMHALHEILKALQYDNNRHFPSLVARWSRYHVQQKRLGYMVLD